MLTVPNQLGVDYNVHVIESILRHVAPAMGWLVAGRVDLAIMFDPPPSPQIQFDTLAREPLVLVSTRVLPARTASLLAALAYMGGPRPIAYTPFGELTVFIFFGLVAVLGTDWVLTGDVGLVSLLAAIALGSIAAAALAVNNHRDIAHDRLVGRRTFAVTFGELASQRLFAVLLLAPFALVPVMAWLSGAGTLLLPLVLLPSAHQLQRDFVHCPRGIAFNALLFRTFRLELWFAALLSAGALLGRVVR